MRGTALKVNAHLLYYSLMHSEGVIKLNKKVLVMLSFLFFVGITLTFTGLTKAQTQEPATPVTAPTVSGHATGGVKADTGDLSLKLDFNAHTDPKGQVNYSDSSQAKFHGKVDQCYSQSENKAIFAGTVNRGNVDGKYFVVEVEDNGQGKNAEPDMLGIMFTDTIPTCEWDETLLNAEVQKGNLVVHQ